MSNLIRLVVGPGESDNVQFGIILRRYRINANLSRAAAAQRFGFSSEFLRLIENGKRTPAAGNMRRILDTYGIPYTTSITSADRTLWIFDGVSVEFVSRIQEARNHDPVLDHIERNTRIVQILRLLPSADDKTLRDIHKKLSSFE
jgi:transcriptional regulator with XRE-family HTH domain